VYFALLDWQVAWYCTEAAAAEFVCVNVIATVPSPALTSRIETALGRNVAALRTGSVVVPQARVDTLRENPHSNSRFMRTSHQICAQALHQSFFLARPEQGNDARTE
jgi:hypothetical protein